MKHHAYLLLAAACVLPLAGCGGGDSPDTMPSAPVGRWVEYTNSQFTGSGSLVQVNAIAARNGAVAVGGIATDQASLVFICGKAGACALKPAAVAGQSSVVAMGFDASNNLYAGFTGPAQPGLKAYLMQLAPNSDAWVEVGTNKGTGSGLDAQLGDKILVSSTISQQRATGIVTDFYGTVALYDANKNLVGSTTHTSAGGLKHVAVDGLGGLYVAGPGYYNSETAPAGHYVWAWNSATNAFAAISTGGVTFTAVKGLASNQAGKIFIAGTGKATVAAVWKYDGSALTDLGFPGELVKAVRYLPYKSTGDGYVIVSGVDKRFNPEVWAYNTQSGSWSALGLPAGSGDTGAIAADPITRAIYVGGKTRQGAHRIWTYSE